MLKLPAAQLAALRTWLIDEGVTYATARQRLREQFNFKVHEAQICRYWQTFCAPVADTPQDAEESLLIDLVIMHAGVPLRVRVSTPTPVPGAEKGPK